MNWLVVTACLVLGVSSSLDSSEVCSEGSCHRHVYAESGQDVSLVCSCDCLTFPAWCTRHHDGYALPEDRLFSVAWHREDQPIELSQPDCNFTNCSGFVFEMDDRSLVLANFTESMSGTYSCNVNHWYNGTCCQDLPNVGNTTVQQICDKGVENLIGVFKVAIKDSESQPFHWSHQQPVYPWVISSIIFGDQPSPPLVSAMDLLMSEHRYYDHFKFSLWGKGETSLWYVYGSHKLTRTLEVYKILQVGKDAAFSCVPDCGYPMPREVLWNFSLPGTAASSDINTFRNPEQKFLQRRWHLHIHNISSLYAFTSLTCELNNSFSSQFRFSTHISNGAPKVHYYLEVNDTSEKSEFGWGPSVPRTPHVVEYIQLGKKPRLCIEVKHNPAHGRLYVGCYAMETKCTPLCEKYGVVNSTLTESENNMTSVWRSYNYCWQPFYGVVENKSFVWEAYQLRNPLKVLHHVIDYRVLNLPPVPLPNEGVENAGGIVGGVCGVILLLLICYLVYRHCQRKRLRNLHNKFKVDDNPMYGQVENDSAMGSPRSETTSFSFADTDGQSERRLTQSPSTDLEMPTYIIPCDEWEVSRDRVHKERLIGAGEFGEVFQGKLLQNDGELINVAIKMTKEDASSKEISDLKSELKLLKEITILGGHPNVIPLIGSCTLDEPLMVLTEYAFHGDLKNYLVHNRRKHSDTPKYERDKLFIGYCADIAAGMDYLSSKKIVHRDLAARNVLVFEDFSLKITDFGLTKYLMDKNYYRVCNHTLLPVKWMAPECIQFKTFTHKSDVWSYGVVIWEICSHGETPYSQVQEHGDLLRRLGSGSVLQPPPDSPPVLKTLMESTWHLEPAQRPTFQEVFQKLKDFIKTEGENGTFENATACPQLDVFNRPN